ncbi:hypothetical protein [Corynebacterium lubricantis]|uniref:hypothetical protein n=1 Tax=Corynebacterium lubricantis TaxID=541095 RepID=UPI00037D8D88|nr:hypothetical protein [Corynebacterium lubricantis]
MAERKYTFKIAISAQADLKKAIKKNPAKRIKLRKAQRLLEEHGPTYPSFNTHIFQGKKAGDENIYISYIENNTPGAWRIHWSWWGESTIVALYIGPHT